MEGLALRIEYIKEFSPDFEINVKLTTVFKCAGDISRANLGICMGLRYRTT